MKNGTEVTGLGGVNAHTSGTEFYGGSSNLAFLDRLFTRARNRARAYSSYGPGPVIQAHDDTGRLQGAHSDSRHLHDDELSIVNLMYSADYPASGPPGTSSSDGSGRGPQDQSPETDRTLKMPLLRGESTPDATDTSANNSTGAVAARLPSRHGSIGPGPPEIEKIFVDTYFTNKHYIHPLLGESVFRARCAKEIWGGDVETRSKRPKGRHRSRFLALCYAVVALGAINAGIDDTSPLMSYYRHVRRDRPAEGVRFRSTLEWANLYFDLAKQALGDVFEISSLETCQALFLMVRSAQSSYPCAADSSAY